MVRGTLHRAILLQPEATEHKLGILKEFSRQATKCANWMLSQRKDRDRFTQFWARVGSRAKQTSGFNSQVVCDLARNVSNTKGNHIDHVTVKFNIPRNCKTFETKKFTFVEFGMYPRNRIAIPIRRNRNLERLKALLAAGWTCKTYGVTSSLEVVAYFSKASREFTTRRNVLGIDINAKNFAFTILTPEGKILKQGYLGQHIWPRKHHFIMRRGMLQSLNALKKLKRMRHRQRNFVRTNLGQMSAEVIKFALQYDADIALENLSRFKPKGRKFNRKVMSIPFSIFGQILEARCHDNGITLNRIDRYRTSRWCTRCGAVSRGHDGANYSLFRCGSCGLVVNSDRKASVAVAAKSLLERSDSPNQEMLQISGRRVPVSGLVRPSPMTRSQMAVPVSSSDRGKLTSFVRG